MARKEAALTLVGVTQYLEPEYWPGWDDVQKQYLSLDATALGRVVATRLEASGHALESIYAIVHDKDEQEVWDAAAGKLVKQLKPRHVHMVLRFKDRASGGTLDRLAAVIGVEPQYVEKAGRGRYAHDNMLSYLTHAKYADKYQYDPSEVATIKGRPFVEIANERREAWAKGRATIQRQKADQPEELDAMRAAILAGELTREQVMLTDSMMLTYSLNKKAIDDAFAIYGERRAMLAAKKLAAGQFRTSIFYVTGAAGSGKTHFAKQLIAEQVRRAAAVGESWSVYRAATSNPLDDWQGQEVIFLDDLRASAMSATEWLLLLDPDNASPASARYRNKPAVAPRLIVMTAHMDPVEFFFFVRNRGGVDEALDQFIRRLTAVVHVVRESDRWAYQVSQIGPVPVHHRMIGPRRDVVSLHYGTQQRVVAVDEDGEAVVVGALAEYVAERSSDLELPRAEQLGLEWKPLDKQDGALAAGDAAAALVPGPFDPVGPSDGGSAAAPEPAATASPSGASPWTWSHETVVPLSHAGGRSA